MIWKETRLTLKQKEKVLALFAKYKIQPDRLIYQVIRDLNLQLMGVDITFSMDRDAITRDNKRIKKIIEIVNQFENRGLKADFFNTISHSFKYPFTLPAANEDRRHIITRCGAIVELLKSHSTFDRAKETKFYPFIASLVNILRPGSFSDDELNDGEIKSFKKYLGKSTFTKREK